MLQKISIPLLVLVASAIAQPIITTLAPPTVNDDTFSTPGSFFGNDDSQGIQNQGFFGNGDGTTSGAFFGANNGGFQNPENSGFNNNNNLNNNNNNNGGFFGGHQQQGFSTQQPPNNNNFFGSQNDQGFQNQNQNQFQNQFQNQNQGQNQGFGSQPQQNQGFQNQGFQSQQTPNLGQITSGQQGVNQGFPISNPFPANQLPPIFGRRK